MSEGIKNFFQIPQYMRLSLFSSQAGRFMGSDSFSPKMVLYQMAIVQAAFYLSFTLLSVFAQILMGFPFSLGQLFDPNQYDLVLSLCFLLDMGLMGVVIFRVIERTRKCLDFVLTMIFFHFIFTLFSNGFPTRFLWWLLQLVGAAGCTLLAEGLCMREARKDIQLGEEMGRRRDDDDEEI